MSDCYENLRRECLNQALALIEQDDHLIYKVSVEYISRGYITPTFLEDDHTTMALSKYTKIETLPMITISWCDLNLVDADSGNRPWAGIIFRGESELSKRQVDDIADEIVALLALHGKLIAHQFNSMNCSFRASIGGHEEFYANMNDLTSILLTGLKIGASFNLLENFEKKGK